MRSDEDALKLLISWLRKPPISQYGSYGYEVYLPALMHAYLAQHGIRDSGAERTVVEWSPHFYAAGWELCRRGILRPGIKQMGLQATPEGASGNGYSITPFGRTWIAESDQDDFVPMEPERFGQLLKPFQGRLGPGFASRAQEAVRCYGAHAYLACCAMAGAAAESIMLAVAIAKTGDEAMVLGEYATARGRSKIETRIIGQARPELQAQFRGLTSLVTYWRNEAAHGKPSRLSDIEAFTALTMLLRFAHFTNDHWAELTERP
jgi:hypothetical protein